MAQSIEIARWEWRIGDPGDPAHLLQDFVVSHGLPAHNLTDLSLEYRARLSEDMRDRHVALLISAAGSAEIAGFAATDFHAANFCTGDGISSGSAPGSPPTPAPGLPDLAAVIFTSKPAPVAPSNWATASYELGDWQSSWSAEEHRGAIGKVRDAIAAGELYQVNMVGHSSAPYRGDPRAGLIAVSTLAGATYGQVLDGPGWAVATGSSELLLSVRDGTIETRPIKGTRSRTDTGRRELLASEKERAEHIMIVDMARNDMAQVATIGSVVVEELFVPQAWCQLWQAESVVRAQLMPGAALSDVLRALCPAASVTGAPKRAAVALIDQLEPVGRGPSMGAMGWLSASGLELAVTIRSVAAVAGRLHVWGGGGITWGSDPDAEVAEAAEKIRPIRDNLYRFAE